MFAMALSPLTKSLTLSFAIPQDGHLFFTGMPLEPMVSLSGYMTIKKMKFRTSGNFEKKAEKLNSPYYSKTEPLEDIEAQQWEKIVNPHSRNKKTVRRAGEKEDSHKIHTLETICLPPKLNGSQGTNRGKRENCALQADEDKDAIKAWLAARATNKNTETVYRKEAERFLLWAAVEKQTAMSSLSIEDCSEYLRWLEQLGRTDEKDWSKRWLRTSKNLDWTEKHSSFQWRLEAL